MHASSRLAGLVERFHGEILSEWIKEQLAAAGRQRNLVSESALRDQSVAFLTAFQQGLHGQNFSNFESSAWDPARAILSALARERAQKGFSPSETATFIFSLKQPLFKQLRNEFSKDSDAMVHEIWQATTVLDNLGLYTTELYQKNREEVIKRQQEEMLELSTPVVKLWDGILGLPMIGTMDSVRSQIVMESLLNEIATTGADVAILDITGVPTVDTLTAQHLLKTVAAARLMGAECILSGIRPQIAQTIVHLNIDLGKVQTKATLADAFALALKLKNLTVASIYHINKEWQRGTNSNP